MAKQPEFGIQLAPLLKSCIHTSERKLKIVNRIIERCDMQPGPLDSPCWVWLGADSGKGNGAGRGYGRIKIDGIVSATHRVMFACFHGYLPPGRDIDHLCHNRACCNPDHLESVTRLENCKRRDAK